MTDNKSLAADMRILQEQAQREGDPFSGKKFGSAVAIHKIASAGQGTVYLGYDFELERRLAIKLVIRDPRYKDSEWAGQIARFKHEAKILAGLQNPHIPQVMTYSADTGDLPPHMVMEFIEGYDLNEHLHYADEKKRRTLKWKIEQLKLFDGVLEALALVHSKDLVHRDIKTDNLMLTRVDDGTANGRMLIKLIDFGITLDMHQSRQTQQGLAVGTVGYMAPEQAYAGEITKVADVYAFGAVLYEILYDEPYLKGHTSALDGLATACKAEYWEERMKLLFAEAQAFTRLAMALEPEQRFQGSYELRGALRVLIRQLEHMDENQESRCSRRVSQQLLCTLFKDTETNEFFGATRLLALQYTLRRSAPCFDSSPSAEHEAPEHEVADSAESLPSIGAVARGELSARGPRSVALKETTPIPFDMIQDMQAVEKRRRKGVLSYLGYAALLAVLGGVFVVFILPRLQPNPYRPSRSPTATAQQDAEVHVVQLKPDASPPPPVSTQADASVPPPPTPAQKTKALYEANDKWCYEKDPRARNDGFSKMWTFHLDCHYKHVRTVAFILKKYDAAFRYAKYLHKKFCRNWNRNKAEPSLVRECNHLLARYKRILDSAELHDRKAYKVHREWIPFQNYWYKRRKHRELKRYHK